MHSDGDVIMTGDTPSVFIDYGSVANEERINGITSEIGKKD